MATELQDNILSANAVKKAMPACMVYALVQSMTFMVDSIVAGHFLGTHAVAAIALGMPAIGLMLSFTGMILHGGFLKLLNAMGRNDMEDYHRIFSVVLVFTVIVDCIFLALCLFGTDGILALTGAGKAAPEAVIMGRLYIRTACMEILFFCLGTLFQAVIATYGYQTDRMICSVACVIVNVVSSVVFVNILDNEIKIAGLGIGSALGTLAQVISAYLLMRRRKIRVKFGFYLPNGKNMVDCLDMLRRGFPSSIDNILDSASSSVVNHIILASFAEGTAVLALVAIIKTLYTIVKTVGRGAFYAAEPLIGILSGAKDNEGIRKTFLTALKYGIIYAVGLAAVLILLKNPLLSFYHLRDNQDASLGLILIALSGIVIVFSFVFNAVYESTGRLLLSLAVAVIPDSILYPLLISVLSKPMGITGIWLAMGYNFIPFFIVFYLIFVIINKTPGVSLNRLLALDKKAEEMVKLDVSIPAEARDVTFVSKRMQDFLQSNGTAPKVAYKAALCTEEIAADYMIHWKGEEAHEPGSGELSDPAAARAGGRLWKGASHKKAFMDIKAFKGGDRLEIIVRNYDEPYNPLVFDKDKEGFSKIGITMVQMISREITHSYAYHLNIVSIVMDL